LSARICSISVIPVWEGITTSILLAEDGGPGLIAYTPIHTSHNSGNPKKKRQKTGRRRPRIVMKLYETLSYHHKQGLYDCIKGINIRVSAISYQLSAIS
jgi:hypothetical protein